MENYGTILFFIIYDSYFCQVIKNGQLLLLDISDFLVSQTFVTKHFDELGKHERPYELRSTALKSSPQLER